MAYGGYGAYGAYGAVGGWGDPHVSPQFTQPTKVRPRRRSPP